MGWNYRSLQELHLQGLQVMLHVPTDPKYQTWVRQMIERDANGENTYFQLALGMLCHKSAMLDEILKHQKISCFLSTFTRYAVGTDLQQFPFLHHPRLSKVNQQ